ncbi:serine protease [Amycolatopsis sp. FDAARGOS 1241]|uniref:S53 family peptidase n=1 Tax=Amycolatopsis sp. FDAARGOS 1241 TaxID=2778070 RepID=UPI001EF2EA87|nr:serine protease [Amycolatopsis sp. FDAARGOS 1241]
MSLFEPAVAPPAPGFRNTGPCSAYYGEKTDKTGPAYGERLPYAPCGSTPSQLRSAYGLDQAARLGADGRGTRIAIVDAFASPTIFADVSEYTKRNDPAHPLTRARFSQDVQPQNAADEDQCGASTRYTEETLDVEAAHAMAPGADILYGGAADRTSIDAAINDVIAGHKADLISNYLAHPGEDGSADQIKSFDQLMLQAVLEGIGVYFASGDNGDNAASLGKAMPNYPAFAQWVTAVGGTSLAIGADGERLFETGWETGKSTLANVAYPPASFSPGSGGGTSHVIPQTFVPARDRARRTIHKGSDGGGKGRVVAGISVVGDASTGFLMGQTQRFPDGDYYGQFREGGTNLSTPLFAGIVAVADSLDHYHHGFLNPALYRRAAMIHDVQHVGGAVERIDFAHSVDASGGLLTSARTLDDPGLTIHTTQGYDDVTGLGSPAGLPFLLLRCRWDGERGAVPTILGTPPLEGSAHR